MSQGALYEFFRDQGSIIAGVLALVAGVLAFVAGKLQASATARAGHEQVAAIQAELDAAKSATEEQDRRAREDLLSALDNESARVAMLAELKYQTAYKRHGDDVSGNVMVPYAHAEVYRITPASVLREGRGIPTLLHGEIRLSIIHLLASIDQLNAFLEVKAPVADLSGQDLLAALQKVSKRAGELQGALGVHGGDRRVG